MWTRHRASKQHPADPAQAARAARAAKVEVPAHPPPALGALDDSQYGVRSFEFGGDPRPDRGPPAAVNTPFPMHGTDSSDGDSGDSGNEHETDQEGQHETPMPAPRELGESPPRYSPLSISASIPSGSRGGEVEGEDEQIGLALAGAMSDMQGYTAGGDNAAQPSTAGGHGGLGSISDRMSETTVHPAHLAPAIEIPFLPLHTRSAQASPRATAASHSPTSAIHSPNPSLASASGASTSEIDSDLDHDTYDFEDSDLDLSSAPPSPTSLTSMASVPSYVASLSSASRSSSPLGLGYGGVEAVETADSDNGQSSREGLRGHTDEGTGGSVAAAIAGTRRDRRYERQGAELVIPELSLPSSSLHLSLRDWDGPVQGVKVVLLGPADLTKRVIRAIGETEECVSVRQEGRGKGVVGVVRDGRMLGSVETGATAEQVRIRALRTYGTLHGLLNPASQDEEQLSEVVRAYSTREDWIHAIVGVHTASRHQAQTLEHLIPVLDTSYSSPISPLGGPTPMPTARADSSSYFDNPAPRILGDVSRVADAIIYAMTASTWNESHAHNEDIRSRSIATFLNWRPPALSGSDSSIDSHSASTPHSGASGLVMDSDPAHLMPTVARAQGGGEWEATLSRRLAQRRGSHQGGVGASAEPDVSVAGAGLGNATGQGAGMDVSGNKRPVSRQSSNDTRRRRSRGKKENVEPLFPPRPTSPPAKSGQRSLGNNGHAGAGRVGKGRSEGKGWNSCLPDAGLGLGSGSASELGLGVSKLVSRTFQGMGKWTKGWRGVVVAAVVVGFVGLRLYFWQ